MLRILAFSVLVVLCALAQTYTASIGGKVTDATALPVAGAAVTSTEEATNTVSRTVTNSCGDFIVSYVKAGSYRVRFVVAGFKEHVESGIQLQINQQRRVDPTLEVGQVNEVIDVSATATQGGYGS